MRFPALSASSRHCPQILPSTATFAFVSVHRLTCQARRRNKLNGVNNIEPPQSPIQPVRITALKNAKAPAKGAFHAIRVRGASYYNSSTSMAFRSEKASPDAPIMEV